MPVGESFNIIPWAIPDNPAEYSLDSIFFLVIGLLWANEKDHVATSNTWRGLKISQLKKHDLIKYSSH